MAVVIEHPLDDVTLAVVKFLQHDETANPNLVADL